MAARKHTERVALFKKTLHQPEVQIEDVQKLCFEGIPDSDGLRAQAWKILLNYAPPNIQEAADILKSSRDLYYSFVDETVTLLSEPAEPDTPKWQSYLKDNDVLRQIDRDVRRTLPDIGMLQTPVGVINQHMAARQHIAFRLLQRMHASSETKPLSPEYPTSGPAEAELHWQIIQRILFIYAVLNPGIGYTQGMSNILAPIYYVFATDPNPDAREYAEADAFHCFLKLMSDIREYYVKSLDNTDQGIQAAMFLMMKRLKQKDLQLWLDMENKQLHPQFFSFKWITLLLSQEFSLPEVLRLWDTLLSVEDKNDFLITICCAMLICVRLDILNGDLADNLELLQRYPISDVHVILQEAIRLLNYNEPDAVV